MLDHCVAGGLGVAVDGVYGVHVVAGEFAQLKPGACDVDRMHGRDPTRRRCYLGRAATGAAVNASISSVSCEPRVR